jgi:hypothetical protein
MMIRREAGNYPRVIAGQKGLGYGKDVVMVYG